MGRRVNTSWYDTYLRSKELEATRGEIAFSDPDVADSLGVKPKTWSRMKLAGRFLDGLGAPIPRERILCGYAPIERLAKLWSHDSEIAEANLDAVLSNQMKLVELEKLIRNHVKPEVQNVALKRGRVSSGKSLFAELERYFDKSKLHPFDAYGGRYLRRRGTLGSPNGYCLYNAKGKLVCLVLCIKPGGWRDPAVTARELYEHALSQRHVAPTIWFVAESESIVLRRLAELTLYWGGSPFDKKKHWLFLSHFNDNGYLQVLFEDYFVPLIAQIKADKGLIAKDELFCLIEPLDGQSAPRDLPLLPLQQLPEPTGNRQYRDIVNNRIVAIGKRENATPEERRDRLETELGL
ncbi:hypothetical protein [Halopseudomonas sabulinigri]|uniref:Uncharacterized protein n=1 Tax=Halopseudomonas sabulinigri TaxID=472181 RepID=A0ABP9ZS72_9GAMM